MQVQQLPLRGSEARGLEHGRLAGWAQPLPWDRLSGCGGHLRALLPCLPGPQLGLPAACGGRDSPVLEPEDPLTRLQLRLLCSARDIQACQSASADPVQQLRSAGGPACRACGRRGNRLKTCIARFQALLVCLLGMLGTTRLQPYSPHTSTTPSHSTASTVLPAAAAAAAAAPS